MSGKLLEAFRRSFSAPDITRQLPTKRRRHDMSYQTRRSRDREPNAGLNAATDDRQPRPRKYHRHYFACY